MVMASITDIDGFGGARGGASLCWVRNGSLLPVVGTIRLDRADLFAMTDADVMDVLLHDLGHTLGIGFLWDVLDLLRSPATYPPSADAHFAGVDAVAAFDAAGGTAYSGSRVPAGHNAITGLSLHWRESVFGTELMTPVQNARLSDPLSAITIQSLNDMGYTADASLAEPYLLPSASTTGTGEGDSARAGTLTESVGTGPIQVVGLDGGVVGVIGS